MERSGQSSPRSHSSLWLACRSIFWAIVFPGMVALFIPWRYFGVSEVRLEFTNPRHWLGGLLIVPGIVVLARCILEFARSGRGTLSPADPPRFLVAHGLYQYVRNPMYLSVTMIVLGQVLLTMRPDLFFYWLAWFAAVNGFVIAVEEPLLRRTFGESYERYSRDVGRWVPRLRSRQS